METYLSMAKNLIMFFLFLLFMSFMLNRNMQIHTTCTHFHKITIMKLTINFENEYCKTEFKVPEKLFILYYLLSEESENVKNLKIF